MQASIGALESQRAELAAQVEDLGSAQTSGKILGEMTAADVRRLLGSPMEDMTAADPETMRNALRSPVERIELPPETYEAMIHYRVGPATKSGEWMASPRLGKPSPCTDARCGFRYRTIIDGAHYNPISFG